MIIIDKRKGGKLERFGDEASFWERMNDLSGVGGGSLPFAFMKRGVYLPRSGKSRSSYNRYFLGFGFGEWIYLIWIDSQRVDYQFVAGDVDPYQHLAPPSAEVCVRFGEGFVREAIREIYGFSPERVRPGYTYYTSGDEKGPHVFHHYEDRVVTVAAGGAYVEIDVGFGERVEEALERHGLGLDREDLAELIVLNGI